MYFDDKLTSSSKKPLKQKPSVVEIAKKSRDERLQNKIQISSAIKLQTCWRRHYVAISFIGKMLKEIEKKIGDIKKLSVVLSLKSIKFATPPDICLDITRKLIVVLRFSNAKVFHIL